ncbi:hypothetical protein ACLB2K_004745 [Fragaria x ananassa]
MLMLKLSSLTRVVTIRGDQLEARGCYAIDQDNGRKRAEVLVSRSPKALAADAYEDLRVNVAAESTLPERPRFVEEIKLVCISDEFPARKTRIGTELPLGVREELMRFLKKSVPPIRQKHKSSEVQSLTGKIAALARFVSRLTDKCAPFLKLLKSQHFKLINWGPEQEEAFRKLKEYHASVPMLSKPIPREMLYLYLAASGTAVSSALIRKDDVIEVQVYYVGKGFTLEENRVAIKGQAAADFISELTPMKDEEESPKNDQPEVTRAPMRQNQVGNCMWMARSPKPRAERE